MGKTFQIPMHLIFRNEQTIVLLFIEQQQIVSPKGILPSALHLQYTQGVYLKSSNELYFFKKKDIEKCLKSFR